MSVDAACVSSPSAETRFIKALVERIKGGNCVLLLGPAVARDPDSHVPLNVMLAHELARDPAMTSDLQLGMQDNLRYVAQLYIQARRDAEELAVLSAEFYQNTAGKTTAFHRDLAPLPFKLCINTVPDDFMFQALREAGKRPGIAHYNFRRGAGALARPPTIAEPLVYYFFGRGSDPMSLVIAEHDLIEFLVAVVRGDPPLPDYLRGRLGDPDTTFLFVGFGFHNWYLRVLLHVLKIYGHRGKTVALEDTGFFSHPEKDQTVVFFSGDRYIDFRLHWDDFAHQLRDEYERSNPASTEPAAAAVDAPRVFLCYASEDREDVEDLGEALEARGIGVWRDKQHLRSGQRWDRVLVEVIQRQVDYVVVVQSARMSARIEGYYRKEIKTALERYAMFDPQYIFVVPVVLPGGSLMPELEELHTIEVDAQTGKGVALLADTVLADWALRRRVAQAAA